jgi:hypothetical protein
MAVDEWSFSLDGHGEPFWYTRSGSCVPGEIVMLVVNSLQNCQLPVERSRRSS